MPQQKHLLSRKINENKNEDSTTAGLFFLAFFFFIVSHGLLGLLCEKMCETAQHAAYSLPAY